MRCQARVKTGKRAGQQCQFMVKSGGHLCGNHLYAKGVTLVSVEQPVNDSSAEAESTSIIEGLANELDSMGLQDRSMDACAGSARRNSSTSAEESDATLRVEISKITLNVQLRQKNRDPPEPVHARPQKVAQEAASLRPITKQLKPRLPVLETTTNLSKALLDSPTRLIPPGIDPSLHPQLREIMAMPPEFKNGFVYVCEIIDEEQQDSTNTIIKIGRTKDVGQRMRGHLQNKGCGKKRIKLLKFYPNTGSGQLREPRRVEMLILKSLQNFQYRKKCACGVIHREHFQVRKNEIGGILKQVQGWVSWSEDNYGFAELPGST